MLQVVVYFVVMIKYCSQLSVFITVLATITGDHRDKKEIFPLNQSRAHEGQVLVSFIQGENRKQAGTELGQAQLKLRLD